MSKKNTKKYIVSFKSHDKQGPFRAYVSDIWFDENTNLHHLRGRLRLEDAFKFSMEKSARMLVEDIKKNPSNYVTMWNIEDLSVEEIL